MQPSEEFRPLPHIYLSARLSTAEAAGPGSGPVRGTPFIARQPRGPREGEGVQIKERERVREARIPTRPVPGHYYTALALSARI